MKIKVESIKIPVDTELLEGKTIVFRDKVKVKNLDPAKIEVLKGKHIRVRLP